ncbi:MAG: electron transfer flavoprotein subunit alpha/FixB family protein, partial [Planctomycetota bacterium]
MAGCILAYAESRDGKLRRGAFEAVGASAIVAKDLGVPVIAAGIGEGLEGEAAELGKFGASKVLLAKTGGAAYASARWARTLASIVKAQEAVAVVLPASIPGKELASLVAAALDTGLLPDITALAVEDGGLVASRPIYAGKTLSRVKALSTPIVVSIRPKAFAAGEGNEGGAPAPVEDIPFAGEEPADAVLTGFEETGGGKIELTEADIIVSGGRGLKGPENYQILEELAGLLNAAVGASRSAVDAGWRPHSDQVGQTGKTVSPDLYIAAGISGAIQHLAGMGSSKTIV